MRFVLHSKLNGIVETLMSSELMWIIASGIAFLSLVVDNHNSNCILLVTAIALMNCFPSWYEKYVDIQVNCYV